MTLKVKEAKTKRLRKLYYVPLEAYENRYTYDLAHWSISQFEALGAKVETVYGLEGYHKIATGQVLDCVTRPQHTMTQISWIISGLQNREMSERDFILFEDMFHPGIEGLFYTMSQMRYAGLSKFLPKIGMRCLAQTVDPDDFVHYTGMAKWMRHYEAMVNSFVDCLFVASTEMLGYIKAAGWTVPVFVTGLPFNKKEVTKVLPKAANLFSTRPNSVVFASRIANEKQPLFLLETTKLLKIADPKISVSILSGSNVDLSAYPDLAAAVRKSVITVHQNLTKENYYARLNNARVLFNSSLQDWVSNTASEADTFGCNLVFPAYRSFPEAFNNDHTRLYVPWSAYDAAWKVLAALKEPHTKQGSFSDYQNLTNARTLDFIKALFTS